MSRFTVEIAGTEYPWTEIAYERDFKFYGKCIEVWIPAWISGISGDDAIVIKRDGSAVTEGEIKKIEPFESIVGGVGMKVTGYTNEQDSEKLPAASRTYNADPQTIITNNLNSNLSAGTISAYGSSVAMEFGSSDNARFDRKQVVEETCFVTGWEIYVSPASAVDFKSACGTDRSATVKFVHGELLHRWDQPHLVNIRDKVTKVIVLGALEGDYLAYGLAGSGDDVMTLDRKNLIDDNTCELAAAVVLADAENDVIMGSFYAINTYSGAAFDVYDTVRIEDARFGVSGDYRIYRIEVRVFAGGEETKIYYTNVTHLTANGERLLDRGIWTLKSGQRVLRDMGRGSHNIINLAVLDENGDINLDAADGLIGTLPVDNLDDDVGILTGGVRDSYDLNKDYIETNSNDYIDAYVFDEITCESNAKLDVIGWSYECSETDGICVRFMYKIGSGEWTEYAESCSSFDGNLNTYAKYKTWSDPSPGYAEGGWGEALYLKIQINAPVTGTVRLRNPAVGFATHAKKLSVT